MKLANIVVSSDELLVLLKGDLIRSPTVIEKLIRDRKASEYLGYVIFFIHESIEE